MAKTDPRTTGHRSQNTRFRGHCRDIAKQLSTPDRTYSAEYVAEAMKRMAVREGYPREVCPIDGRSIPQSEALANREEAALLITQTQDFADQHAMYLTEYIEGKPTRLYSGEWRSPYGD